MVEFREDTNVISNIDRKLSSSYAQKIYLFIAEKYSINMYHSRTHTHTHTHTHKLF